MWTDLGVCDIKTRYYIDGLLNENHAVIFPLKSLDLLAGALISKADQLECSVLKRTGETRFGPDLALPRKAPSDAGKLVTLTEFVPRLNPDPDTYIPQ